MTCSLQLCWWWPYCFENTVHESWDEFIGGVRSAAFAPNAEDADYAGLEEVHREVFESRSFDGLLEIVCSTVVDVGMYPKRAAKQGAGD